MPNAPTSPALTPEAPQASSSRVREALAAGQLQRVAGYLGRRYRLVAVAGPSGAVLQQPESLWCALGS
jgi:hypothetical protein